MPQYLEFPLEDGGTILIEVDDADGRPTIRGELESSKLLKRVDNTFDTAVDNIRNTANILLQKLTSLPDAPDEMEITFGLKATGELGGSFVIAKAGLEANYGVKLIWKKKSDA